MHISDLKPWVMPVSLIIKILVGLLLFILHFQTYGIDELSHDGETFFKEGKHLNNVFFDSPITYFKFLTGIGENDVLIQKHLFMTEYWSGNTLTLTNDSKNVIRFHSIIHFFSMNSVYVHLSVLCFLSLAGVRNLYLSIRKYSQLKPEILFWCLLLVPSTIFWTSSMMKEPFLFFGMTLLLRSILLKEGIWKRTIFITLSLLLLLGFKPYVLICILAALFFVVSYRYFFSYKLLPSLITSSIFTIFSVLFFNGPRDQIVHFITRKQFDFVNVGKGGIHALSDTCFYYFQPHQYESVKMSGNQLQVIKPVDAFIIEFGTTTEPLPIHLEPSTDTLIVTYFTQGCMSYIETTPINNSFTQLLKNIPEAFINSIIRPFPNDPGSNLKYLSFLEVWFLFGFLIFAIIRHRKLNNEERSLIIGLLIFAMLLFLIIGWTTPVIGAITRYRFPAQLALVIIGLILIKPPKLFKR
jgi:hypothetical protein